MSTMKAVDKLRAMAGGNIAESMGRHQGGAGAGASPNFQAARTTEQERFSGLNRVKGAFQIPVDRLAPDPHQPRKEFDPEALLRLAHSLKDRGQLQPIRVRWDAEPGRWVIIAGERRWRAAVQAGLAVVAAVEVSGPLTEDEVLEEQLIENCIREDLKPVEQARAYKALMDRRSLSQVQLAERLNIGQSTIAKAVALLNLPAPIQASVDAGAIGPNTAYELTKIADPAEQAALAHQAAVGQVKRDEIQERARTQRQGSETGKAKPKAKAKKVTERTFKTTAGPKITVEFKRGLDGALMLAAARELVGRLEAEQGSEAQDAA